MRFAAKWVAVAAAAVVGLSVLLAPPATATTDTGAGVDTINWQPCAANPQADCGWVTVPIDWSHPSGPTIQLAVSRVRASDPAERVGSIVVNPGGPGGPGAEAVASGFALSSTITSRFDTIGFDPRGVGLSHPVVCGGNEVSAPHPDIPATSAQFAQLAAYNTALARSCRALTGPLFDFLDTESVARDMDAIRAALGEKKLNFYGISYGTLMGQEYAATFPTHVGVMVLDSNMDHSQTSTWQFLESQSASTEANFTQFVAWCEQTAACLLHGQDVPALVADLYARAQNGQLIDPYVGAVSPYLLISVINSLFYDPSWQLLADELIYFQGLPTTAAARASRQDEDPPVAESFQPIFCEDWRLPVHNVGQLDAMRTALATVITTDLKYSPLAMRATIGCIGWPAKVNNPQQRLSIHGAPPILMLNSRYDPATPYPWAVTASQQSGAVLLTYDGWGHGAYFKNSQCVIDATDHYLLTGVTPPRGTHCPAVPPSTTEMNSQFQPAVPKPVGPLPAIPGWLG
jgi:pimeloyl-ACP methyl ester carboxylesterase